MKSLEQHLITVENSLIVNNKPQTYGISKLEPDELKVASALETMIIGRCSPIEVKEHLKTCIALSGCQTPTIEIWLTIPSSHYSS